MFIYFFIFIYQVQKMKKKLLIVSDYLDNIWGIESYIKNLKQILQDDYKVYYFWWKNFTKVKKTMFLFFSINNFVYAKKFKQQINEIQPDIIRFHSVLRVLGPNIIKQVNDFKWLKIMTYHDLWYFSLYANEIISKDQIATKFSFLNFIKKSKKWKLLLPYSIFKYIKLKKIRDNLNKNIDIHTVPSKFMLDYVKLLWYWTNIKILPNFIDKNYLIERKNIFQDKINFIFFWRFTKEKWASLIINLLSSILEWKFKDREKYNQITSNIRIFIFWDWEKKKDLLETFSWTDIYWNDIWIIQNLSTLDNYNLQKHIDQKEWKFVYYFWKRDFEIIKDFISFSHYNLVPSLLLETFWLSAVEWAANWLVNIWFDKENITNFILDNFKIDHKYPTNNFVKKILNIIEKHNLSERKKYSLENKELVKKFII